MECQLPIPVFNIISYISINNIMSCFEHVNISITGNKFLTNET